MRRLWPFCVVGLVIAAVVVVLKLLFGMDDPFARPRPTPEMTTICTDIEAGRAGIEALPRVLELIEREPWTGEFMSAGPVAQLGPAAVPQLRAAWKSGKTSRQWLLLVYSFMGPQAIDALPEIEEALKIPELDFRAERALLSVGRAGGAAEPLL